MRSCEKCRRLASYMDILMIISAAIICFSPLLNDITGRVVSDNMGCLRLGMRLAGCNSDFDSDAIPYYGQMYYVFFFPLFKMTSNPYSIYKGIIYINEFVRFITAILIYKIQIGYFELDKDIAASLTVIALLCFPENSIVRFNNETPLFFLLYLSLFCFLKVINTTSAKRIQMYFAYVGCFVICGYGLLVHTRWILFYLCIFFSIVVSDFVYKRKCIALRISPVVMIIFLIYRAITKAITNYIWGARDVHNNGLELSLYFSNNIISLRAAILIILSNIYRLCILTYGIPIIGIALVLVLIISFFKHDKNYIATRLSYNQFFLLFLFTLVLSGQISGLVIYYGTPITDWLNTGVINDLLSGMGYDRYYIMYAGPLLIAIFSILQNKDIKKTYVLQVLALYGLFLVADSHYFTMGKYGYLFYTGALDLGKFKNIYVTFIFTLFCLLSILFFHSLKKERYVLMVISLLCVILSLTSIKRISTNIEFESEYNAAYNFFQEIDPEYQINGIYSDIYQLQYALLDRRVFIFDDSFEGNPDYMYISYSNMDKYQRAGYFAIEVDEDEFFLIKNKDRYKEICTILEQHG